MKSPSIRATPQSPQRHSGMRGFVASYSAVTGEELWRFYTIPAKGETGSESWGDFAVEWGGGLNPNHRVRVAYVRGKRLIQYRIADPGPGFSFPLARSSACFSHPSPSRGPPARSGPQTRPRHPATLRSRAETGHDRCSASAAAQTPTPWRHATSAACARISTCSAEATPSSAELFR